MQPCLAYVNQMAEIFEVLQVKKSVAAECCALKKLFKQSNLLNTFLLQKAGAHIVRHVAHEQCTKIKPDVTRCDVTGIFADIFQKVIKQNKKKMTKKYLKPP